LHYSVFPCSAATVQAFTDAGLDFLSTLAAGVDVPVDELLAANIRGIAGQQAEPQAFLETAGRQLAQLLHADYGRLAAIVRRCLGPLENQL
ncbi:MAG: hypothetical protein M3336_17690, partial [Chloroflexota bacterium]|nr:hypothetical protein [Chloroflexota bacterium]